MDLQQLQARARDIANLYDRYNAAVRGRIWTTTDYMSGFVGDVGDLSKLVAAREGIRDEPCGSQGIGHEVSDCLWSVLILADQVGMDLEGEFLHAMDDLERSTRDRINALYNESTE